MYLVFQPLGLGLDKVLFDWNSVTPETKPRRSGQANRSVPPFTRDQGLIIRPNTPWHFDCWVDADYVGNWRYTDAHIDPMTSKSRSGWVVRFAGAPITWASKMQTIMALSTTEAEYIALSTGSKEVIPLVGILKEARENGLRVEDLPPKVHCTVFEDNSGALELARLPNAPMHQTYKPSFSPLP